MDLKLRLFTFYEEMLTRYAVAVILKHFINYHNVVIICFVLFQSIIILYKFSSWEMIVLNQFLWTLKITAAAVVLLRKAKRPVRAFTGQTAPQTIFTYRIPLASGCSIFGNIDCGIWQNVTAKTIDKTSKINVHIDVRYANHMFGKRCRNVTW